MQNRYSKVSMQKKQLVCIVVFSIVGFVIGLILVMQALTRVQYSKWSQYIVFTTVCPPLWQINFLRKINIFKVIFITALAINTFIFLVLTVVSFYYAFHIQKWILNKKHTHTFYSISICFGVLTNIIFLLYSIKLLVNCISIQAYYENKITRECFSPTSYGFLVGIFNTMWVMFGLSAAMFVLWILNVIVLPAKKVGLKERQFIKQKRKQGLEVLNFNKDEISQNQLMGITNNAQNELILPIDSRLDITPSPFFPNNPILTVDQCIETQSEYFRKYYSKQDILIAPKNTINQLQNKIKTQQIGVETERKQMKHQKIQVIIEIPNPYMDNIQYNKIDAAVWTGDADNTLYNSFRAAEIEQQNLQTQYKSCENNNDDIWNLQAEGQNQKQMKNEKGSKTQANSYKQFNSQSETVKNQYRHPIVFGSNPMTPSARTQSYFRKDNPIYAEQVYIINYPNSNKKLQSKVKSQFLQQNTFDNKTLKKLENKNKLNIEQKIQQQGTIFYTAQSHENEVLKQKQTKRRRDKVNKLRSKFKNISNSQNKFSLQKDEQQQSWNVQNNTSKQQKQLRNLKLDQGFFDQDAKQSERIVKEKKQLMEQYSQKSQQTPHHNQLKNKGEIPYQIKRKLQQLEGKNNQCNIFQINNCLK